MPIVKPFLSMTEEDKKRYWKIRQSKRPKPCQSGRSTEARYGK